MSFKPLFARALGAAPGRLHFAAHSHHLWPDASREGQIECWDDAAALWRVSTSGGELTARYLVLGSGGLSEPARPDIPGIDTFAGTTRYDESRNGSAVFGGWRAAFGAFDAELSARHDHDDDFGGATTGSVAFGWRANDALRAYASFAQGFRSPTMNELYDPGYGGYYAGNPELDPERSHSSELGLEFTP